MYDSLYYETYFHYQYLIFRRFLMFDDTDADWATAQALYKRCAYEALKSLRANQSSAATKWVNLAGSLAELWKDSDIIV
jgi:hypothetical protein